MADKYEVTRKRITRSRTQRPGYRDEHDPDDVDPEVFEEGDIIEPTEDELEAFGDRLRPLRDEEVEEGN